LNITITLDKHQCGGLSPNVIKSVGVQSILSLETRLIPLTIEQMFIAIY